MNSWKALLRAEWLLRELERGARLSSDDLTTLIERRFGVLNMPIADPSACIAPTAQAGCGSSIAWTPLVFGQTCIGCLACPEGWKKQGMVRLSSFVNLQRVKARKVCADAEYGMHNN